MYKVGTFLHGNSGVGNIWIILMDNSNLGALLWDGRNQQFCPDSIKRDTMSTGMREADADDIRKLTNAALISHLPQWARDLRNRYWGPATLTPAQMSVVKQSNIIPEKKIDVKPQIKVESNCTHDWKPYFGFNENFDYCSVCDAKRKMAQ